MGKTIIVFEDGKVVDTIEEEKWEGVKVENGRLVANISESARTVSEVGLMIEAENASIAAAPTAVETPVPETPAVETSGVAAFAPAADIHAESLLEEIIPAEVVSAEASMLFAAADAAAVDVPSAEELRTVTEQAAQMNFTVAGETVSATSAATEQATSAARAADVEYPWQRDAYENVEKNGAKRDGGVDAKKVIAIILGLLLATGAGFGGGVAAVNTGVVFLNPPAQQITINPSDQLSTTEAVAAKVSPSVVGITSMATRTVDIPLFGSYENKSGGVGTGIIVDESGYILTNSHVVLDGQVDTLTVLLPDGRDVRGDILWNERGLDLAIVKVDAGNLVAAELGDSDSMRLGSYVAAIGNPMGLNFRGSISQGVVSGLDRAIVAVSEDSGSSREYDDIRNLESNPSSDFVPMEGLIQVDAAINQGNSGGPLINSLGQVIGINTARNQNGEGMGFAIPINTAKPIVDSIKATGEFHRVYIGVTPVDVSEFLQSYPESDFGVESGAYVYRVTPGSPAEAAGIQETDIIVEVDGKKIDTSLQLIKHLLGYKAGDVVEVRVVRDKQERTVKVTLTDVLPE